MTDTDRPAPPPPARDVVDGIPDRAAHRPRWKYILLGAIFLAWVGVLYLLHVVGTR